LFIDAPLAYFRFRGRVSPALSLGLNFFSTIYIEIKSNSETGIGTKASARGMNNLKETYRRQKTGSYRTANSLVLISIHGNDD
jgi:hypothetical protein